MHVQMKSLSDDSVLVSRISNFSGKMNQMEIPLKPIEFTTLFSMWKDKGLTIQDVFVTLNEDQREFLVSGMTPDEWDACFPDE